MADTKISNLAAHTSPIDTDVIPIVDVTAGATKKITKADLTKNTTHNNLAGLNGGTADQYYHLTSAQHTIATQAATAALNGYATSTQITKLDGIATAATANAKASAAEIVAASDDTKFTTAKGLKDAGIFNFLINQILS